MKINLCPSMMCARYENLENEIRLLENAGADIFHLDIMDGKYVPNFALGLNDISCICKNSHIPCELHLMIENPSNYISLFAKAGVNIMYIHPETEYYPITTLQKIHDLGLESGIVISPDIAIEKIIELLNVTKRVLVMTVNPGYAGQTYLPYVEKKIHKLLELQKEYGFSIGVDGACNAERIKHLSALGVENFVLGTTALFCGNFDYHKNINNIRNAIKH